MENRKLGFEDFILAVDDSNKIFVEDLHEELMKCGCKIEVKSAKSGYVVSYIHHKKTIANYVFRRTGLIMRIYANQVNRYGEFLDTLPDAMAESIKDASICKRLVNPGTCNPKCATGYDFYLRGVHYQKCRNNAFMFLLSEENNAYIKTFLMNEIKVCVD